MEPENQQQQPKVKLYVYGSRESDQFWLPGERSHSRKPVCLTDLQEFKLEGEGQDGGDKIIRNPLFQRTVYEIACGGLHSVVLTDNGEVYTFGCNDEGALGRKGTECLPEKVALDDPIDMISAGDNHSLFANSVNGAIYFAGNYNYQRGEKMRQESVFEPQCIYTAEISSSNKNKRLTKIASGANHSVVLVGGKLYCRGDPEAFTIGRRMSKRHKVENSLTFNGVLLSDIVDVECGGYFTVVKVKKGKKISYHAWGINSSGQLGLGNYESVCYPVEIKKLRNKNVVKMAAGTAFMMFLTEEGELIGCGSNQYGNLGLGDEYKYEPSQEGELMQNEESKPVDHQEQQHKESEPIHSEQPNSERPSQPVQQPAQQPAQQPPKQGDKGEKQAGQQGEQVQNKQAPQAAIAIEQNVYIKSLRPIPVPEKVENISAGADFGFGWNKDNLYTWGFGSSYVLLNGSEQDETTPFKVKNTIINNHTIHQLCGGGQHVMYTSYPNKEQTVEIKQMEDVWKDLTTYKKKLKRRK